MILFIGFVILIAIFVISNNIFLKDKYIELVLLVFTFYFTVLIAGYRQPGVGADDFAYLEIFSQVPKLFNWIDGTQHLGSFASKMEPGFLFYISVLKQAGISGGMLFLFSSLLSIFLVFYFYRKLSPLVFLSILIFVCHAFIYRDMNQLRSALACGFGGLIILSIYRERLLIAIFFFIISLTFHIGSVVYILLFLFYKLGNLGRFKSSLILSLSLIIGFFGITDILISVLPDLGRITTKIVNYSNSATHGAEISLYSITNLKNIAIVLFGLIYWKKLAVNRLFSILWFSMLLNTCWRIAFTDFSILAARGATFFSIVEPVLLAYYASSSRFKNQFVLVLIFYSFFMLYLNVNVKQIISFYQQIIL